MNTNCVVYKTVDVVAKRWSLLIILSIHKGGGKKRYSEIKKDLPDVTPKMLSTRLKELEKQKIIEKETKTIDGSIFAYYVLTESGQDLINIIDQIKKWGLKWKVHKKDCESTLCKHCLE